MLATIHARVELRRGGLVVVNWFTKSLVPWSAVDSVVVDDPLALVLRDGRRVDIAAWATSPASSVTGFRMQARMKRLIEEARETGSDVDGKVHTRPDLWLLPLSAVVAVLLVIGWLGVR